MREVDLNTFMFRMLWKSGSLNLLEPSGPHRAGYGTTLHFLLTTEIMLVSHVLAELRMCVGVKGDDVSISRASF